MQVGVGKEIELLQVNLLRKVMDLVSFQCFNTFLISTHIYCTPINHIFYKTILSTLHSGLGTIVVSVYYNNIQAYMHHQ